MFELENWVRQSFNKDEKHYENDCPNCIFLGCSYLDDVIYDLYFCRIGAACSSIRTVHAIYGNEAHARMSGLHQLVDNAILREAHDKAVAQGCMASIL